MNDIEKLFGDLTKRADATGQSIDDVNAGVAYIKSNAVTIILIVVLTLIIANLIALTIFNR